MECSSRGNFCEILFHAQPWDEDVQFAANILDGKPEESLKKSDNKGNGDFEGTLLNTTNLQDKEGVWMQISCKLFGYQTYGDLVSNENGFPGVNLTDHFYEHFLDCVSVVEDLLAAL
jgi:hypothetical protein